MQEIDAQDRGGPRVLGSQGAVALARQTDAPRVVAAPTGALGESPLVLDIVSEVRFVRDSLTEILGRDDAIRVAATFTDCAGVLAASRELRPDMVLLDATLPNGPLGVARLREAMSGVLLVVFAISESVEAVLAWAEAGVDGYIPSTAAASDLQGFIADIRAGRQACSGRVAAGLLHRIASAANRPPPIPADAKALTPREFEIVRLISQGLTNKDIARRLDIGVSTAKSHVHNALLKLNLERRAQIASLMRARAR